MKESLMWLSVFFVVLTSVSMFILMLIPLGDLASEALVSNTYRFIIIFHSMIAGITLGEFFKIRNSEKTGKGLLIDLVEELRVNKDIIDSDTKLRKGFWLLSIRSGLARYLPYRERRMLWNIYSNITHYNEEMDILHQSNLRGESDALPQSFLDEISNLRRAIKELIDVVLERHSTEEYI
ncbi:MAG: hypothetical protein RTU30_07090 [Candidatus Thorarchaeota archaeon]